MGLVLRQDERQEKFWGPENRSPSLRNLVEAPLQKSKINYQLLEAFPFLSVNLQFSRNFTRNTIYREKTSKTFVQPWWLLAFLCQIINPPEAFFLSREKEGLER